MTGGYRALHGPDARGGVVQVRAYTRTVEDRVQQVGAHARGAPPTGEGGTAGGEAPIRQVQAPFFLFARPPILPPGSGIPMRRIPNQSGKEAARDTSSFAHGARRLVGETPTQFAHRVMNERYGDGGWSMRQPRQRREFNQIRKLGERAFEAPSTGAVIEEGII